MAGQVTRRLIDLSMEVYKGMMTYPNVAKPVIVEMESHREMARSVGTDQYGVDEITNHCMIVTGDHIGTHIDSWGHVKPDAPRAEGIPIEYCYGDGVVLDLTHKRPGEEIGPGDIDEAERKLDGYRIKPLDIVLLRTDAAKQRTEKAYLTDHPGMTKEAVHAVLDRGVMVMGIDAIGFDPPVAKMFERRKFWEAHRVMREREYLPPREPVQPPRDPGAVSFFYRERAAREVARRLRRPRPRGRDRRRTPVAKRKAGSGKLFSGKREAGSGKRQRVAGSGKREAGSGKRHCWRIRMIVLTAKYFVKAGRGDEVEAALRRMAPLVKAGEPGCTVYHANRSAENRDLFLLYEHYTDQAALEAHRNTPHFKEIIEGTIVPLLDKRERELYQSVLT